MGKQIGRKESDMPEVQQTQGLATTNGNREFARAHEAKRFPPGIQQRGPGGNPYAAQVQRLRKTILSTVTPAKLAKIINALVARAVKGDTPSARLVLEYAVGRPITLDDEFRPQVPDSQRFTFNVYANADTANELARRMLDQALGDGGAAPAVQPGDAPAGVGADDGRPAAGSASEQGDAPAGETA